MEWKVEKWCLKNIVAKLTVKNSKLEFQRIKGEEEVQIIIWLTDRENDSNKKIFTMVCQRKLMTWTIVEKLTHHNKLQMKLGNIGQ